MIPPGFDFQGILYRAHDSRWSWATTSGEGARLRGGRFNPAGIPALYLSHDSSTAFLEANAGFAFKFQPTLMCAYRVNLSRIYDTTGHWVSRSNAHLGTYVDPDDLACAWELMSKQGLRVPSWIVSERLIAAGFGGIAVRSFAVGSSERNMNFVLWQWDETTVSVVDDHGRLPMNGDSWSK